MAKECLLEEKVCINCGKCNYCDLDSLKICDNCCKCIGENTKEADYKTVEVNEIEETTHYVFNKEEQKIYFSWLKEKYQDKKTR